MPSSVSELRELLGRGGIGETWSASDPDGEPLAIKRVSCAEETTRAELLRRVAAVRTLTADRRELFVRVRDAWSDGPDVWIASDRDTGVSLRRLLRIATLTPAQVVTIGSALLAGAAALHRTGVCHGAVHAGNVHIGLDGRVRLGDSGLAPVDPRGVRRGEAGLARRDLDGIAATLRAAIGADRHRRHAYRLPAGVADVVGALEGGNGSSAEAAHQALMEGAEELSDPEVMEDARRQLMAIALSIAAADGSRPGVVRQTPAEPSPAPISPPATSPARDAPGFLQPGRLALPPRSVPFVPPAQTSPCPLHARHRLLTIATTLGCLAAAILLAVTLLHYR